MSACGTAGCQNEATWLAVEVDESQEFLPAYFPYYWLVCAGCKKNVSVFVNVLLIPLCWLKEMLHE